MESHDPRSALSAAARSMWAKSGDGEMWMPLHQHMVDSAEVAGRLWDDWASEALRRTICEQTRLEAGAARSLLTWLAGTHDIGKASKWFAAQVDTRPGFDRFVTRITDAGVPLRKSSLEAKTRIPHGTASGAILRRWLADRLGFSRDGAARLSAVADAHHGIPTIDFRLRQDSKDVLDEYEDPWPSIWNELLSMVTELTSATAVLKQLASRGKKTLNVQSQMLFTGLVIMADWIASNTEAFPLGIDSDQATRTEDGVSRVALTDPWRPAPLEAIAALMTERFDWPTTSTPRPVQQVLAEVARASSEPTLFIVEAPTGEGKTEAALTAAEILAARHGAGGVFFGAPTMSTSDALFSRIADWAGHAVPHHDIASLYLGHSKSDLNTKFAQMRFAGIDEDDTTSGNVIAAQWLTGRKKGILSNFVVGTVDQLLLLALQSRHAMLRHLGLAGKVIVVDEVHAYDTYMNSYLHRAIEWLADYGASIILLSATLPVATRRELALAYARGCNARVAEDAALTTAYPLVTSVSRSGGLIETPVPPRPTDVDVEVELLADDETTLVSALREGLADGGCALVLCNSVRRAQQAIAALPPDLRQDAELLHARFIAADRLDRERRLTDELGPDARRGTGRPSRRIVVATQVAEQSLDIDVDLLVTDLAPIDLVLQRMGRLHRHRRPADDRPSLLQQPRMLIRGVLRTDPEPLLEPDSWAIYDHQLMLATLGALQQHGDRVRRPDDVPGLVQSVYGAQISLPGDWSEAWSRAVTEHAANQEAARSRARTFQFPSPYSCTALDALYSAQTADVASSPAAEERGFAQVRDTEPSIEVVLIVDVEDGYTPLPWLGDVDPLVDTSRPISKVSALLARSTVRLPRRFGVRHFESALDELEKQTPMGWRDDRLLRGSIALRLNDDLSATLCGVNLRYDRELGLAEVR